MAAQDSKPLASIPVRAQKAPNEVEQDYKTVADEEEWTTVAHSKKETRYKESKDLITEMLAPFNAIEDHFMYQYTLIDVGCICCGETTHLAGSWPSKADALRVLSERLLKAMKCGPKLSKTFSYYPGTNRLSYKFYYPDNGQHEIVFQRHLKNQK